MSAPSPGSAALPVWRVPEAPGEVLRPERLGPEASRLLIPFLQRQRWFGAKSRRLEEIELLDLVPLPGTSRTLVLARARFAAGPAETYQLVLGLRPAAESVALPIARVEVPGAALVLEEALSDPAAGRQLLELAATGARLPGEHGHVECAGDARLAGSRSAPLPARPMGAEQSNTSLILGDSLVLKIFRKLEEGLNPDLEVGRFLTTRGFRHIPQCHGWATYRQGPRQITLAMIQGFVPSRGDGWRDALAAVGALCDGGEVPDWGERAARLGAITAHLHLALAGDPREPDFAPEPVGPQDVDAWRASMQRRLERTWTSLGTNHPEIARLRPGIERTLDQLLELRDLGRKLRHHGDYHLGQVLRTEEDWIILDFEGEPARSLAERRAKHTVLRDVAGMLRSFSYAASAALFERATPDDDAWAPLAARADAWEQRIREAFLGAYWATAAGADFLPSSDAARTRLLTIFELDKAVYELGYELDNRPTWVRIPLHAIERLASGGQA